MVKGCHREVGHAIEVRDAIDGLDHGGDGMPQRRGDATAERRCHSGEEMPPGPSPSMAYLLTDGYPWSPSRQLGPLWNHHPYGALSPLWLCLQPSMACLFHHGLTLRWLYSPSLWYAFANWLPALSYSWPAFPSALMVCLLTNNHSSVGGAVRHTFCPGRISPIRHPFSSRTHPPNSTTEVTSPYRPFQDRPSSITCRAVCRVCISPLPRASALPRHRTASLRYSRPSL
jgi:hypothetical protein